jgi:hypothetical protein
MTHAMRSKITAMALALVAALTLAVAGSCEGTSGTYQGGNDSEPYFR